MPMTVISGKPGSGKTALVVQMLKKWKEDKANHGRHIYIDIRPDPKDPEGKRMVPSIPELKIEHKLLANAKEWALPGVIEDGSLVVCDEAQELWRIRPSGSKVPEEVASMERHRHRGTEMIFLTQAPNLLDQNLRGLVNRHIHLRDMGVYGRRWNEWFEEVSDVGRSGLKAAPVQKKWKLPPKDVLALYRSASMHVRTRRTVPPVLMLAIVGALGLAWLIWRGYASINAKIHPMDPGLTVKAPGATARPMEPPMQKMRALFATVKIPDREPYAGLGVHVAGAFRGPSVLRSWFNLSVDGRVVGTVADRELQAAGYAIRWVAPCSVVLIFGERERFVTCDAPVSKPAPPMAGMGPERPASGADA